MLKIKNKFSDYFDIYKRNLNKTRIILYQKTEEPNYDLIFYINKKSPYTFLANELNLKLDSFLSSNSPYDKLLHFYEYSEEKPDDRHILLANTKYIDPKLIKDNKSFLKLTWKEFKPYKKKIFKDPKNKNSVILKYIYERERDVFYEKEYNKKIKSSKYLEKNIKELTSKMINSFDFKQILGNKKPAGYMKNFINFPIKKDKKTGFNYVPIPKGNIFLKPYQILNILPKLKQS